MRMLTLLCLVTAVLACACDSGPTPVSTADAEALVRKVLDEIAAGRGEAIYDAEFSEDFRRRISREVWSKIVKHYADFGQVQELAPLQVTGQSIEPGVEDAIVQYRVVWEKGQGGITVNMSRGSGQPWKITNLDFDSAPAQAGAKAPAVSRPAGLD